MKVGEGKRPRRVGRTVASERTRTRNAPRVRGTCAGSEDVERVDDNAFDRRSPGLVVSADDVDRQRVAAGRETGSAEQHRLITLLKRRVRVDARDELAVDRNVG